MMALCDEILDKNYRFSSPMYKRDHYCMATNLKGLKIQGLLKNCLSK